jgi:uncharacterized membrane protein YeaQ/YmgE (transglycosylase-associated protein family)
MSVRRESNAGKGAKYGFVIGAAAGVIAGVIVAKELDERDSDLRQFATLTLGLGGALVGTGVGAAIGASSHRELWRTVEVERP